MQAPDPGESFNAAAKEPSTSLRNKVAVVTGAGQGLGRAYALAMAQAGAAVVVNDIDAERAEDVAQEIRSRGLDAVAEICSIGSTQSAEELVDRAVREFGQLDIMCANAGVLRDRVLWKMEDEDFDLVVQTHLRGTFTCGRAAVQHMRTRGEGGSLILVGSPAGQRSNFGQSSYVAAKAGIVGLARVWATECARAGITVNAIIPAALTQMTASIPGYAALLERAAAGEPLPRLVRRQHAIGPPEDVSGLVVFLASDAARSVTGQSIGVGGDRLTLWSHPSEVANAYLDGGWAAEDIAEAWPTTFGPQQQSYGLEFPELPEGIA